MLPGVKKSSKKAWILLYLELCLDKLEGFSKWYVFTKKNKIKNIFPQSDRKIMARR